MRPEELIARRDAAKAAAHDLLETHEASIARVVELRGSFERLGGLPVDVAEYYREALRALQVGCYRAAMVMAWAGFIYMVAEHMVVHQKALLTSHYPKWKTGTTGAFLQDVKEYQILEAGKKLGLYDNQRLNIYKGWLSQRNQAAHPTLYRPSRNVALGFADAVVSEVGKYV